MNKKVFSVLISLILMIVFVPVVAGDTINCYSNTDPESSTVGLLVNVMRSDPAYDPFDQYVVCRSSDTTYTLAFGADLNAGATVYIYTQQLAGVPARLTRSEAASIAVNDHGYYYCGNAFDGIVNSRAESYKYQSVLIVAVVVIVLLILLKLFRRSAHNKIAYYSVR